MTVTDANIASYSGQSLPSTWISDRDVYSAGGTPTTGAQVVYKLATPLTYQLTPEQVFSLLGENNIFSDTGDIDLTYIVNTKAGNVIGEIVEQTKEIEAKHPKYSNPNLLDNGWFTVNQRGVTTGATNGQYFLDRWVTSYGTA